MSTVIWNARGLGCKRAFLLLQQLVADLRPLLLFVCESKIPCKTANWWLSSLHFDHVFGVDAKGSKGGLLLFWNNKIDVSLHSYSLSHIDVSVVWESINWRFTGCYAPSIPEERLAFWELLFKQYKRRNNDCELWLLGDDFNDIMFDSEKRGGIKKKRGSTNNLYNYCKHIKVYNVTTIGPKYTWNNKRRGRNNIRERLDRTGQRAMDGCFPKILCS